MWNTPDTKITYFLSGVWTGIWLDPGIPGRVGGTRREDESCRKRRYVRYWGLSSCWKRMALGPVMAETVSKALNLLGPLPRDSIKWKSLP